MARPAGPHDQDTEIVTWRSGILLAPGGRFRQEYEPGREGPVRGCDGEAWWEVRDDEDEGYSPDGSPCDELLCPAWLPSGFELELAGGGTREGRPVLHIVATPRPLLRAGSSPGRDALIGALPSATRKPGDALLDRIDAVLDTESGILLSCARILGGQVVSRSELTYITGDPAEAADRNRFACPADDGDSDTGNSGTGNSGTSDSGSRDAAAPETPFGGPGWRLAKTAASLSAAALATAVRLKAPGRADPQQEFMTRAGNWPAASRSGRPSLDILELLYRSGLQVTGFEAEIAVWLDLETALAAMKRAGNRWGMNGLGQLADAIAQHGTQQHQRLRIIIGAADRYRIDYIERPGNRRPRTVAVDGTHRWRVYDDRTTVGPATPMPADIARLVDPAWLLNHRLTGGEEVSVDGRRAFAVGFDSSSWPEHAPAVAEASIDAELGVLLQVRQTSAGNPVSLVELRQLRTGQPRAPEEFRVEIPPGTRTVEDVGGFLDDVPVPPAVRLAADLAKRAVSSATAAHAFADRLRRGDARQSRWPS